WLKSIRENIEIGNPWEDIENEEMNDLNFDSYEEIFNNKEQIIIEKKLDLFLLEFEKLKIDTNIIKEDIQHLKTMSGKISKKDWILLFLGSTTSWIFASLLPPEHTHTIWNTVKG